ncbi:hypothetical protein N8609_00985 [Verrucomicrobia bacterium]|nr:hypothetical protein [Verrucomicrobiota bacterium]
MTEPCQKNVCFFYRNFHSVEIYNPYRLSVSDAHYQKHKFAQEDFI